MFYSVMGVSAVTHRPDVWGGAKGGWIPASVSLHACVRVCVKPDQSLPTILSGCLSAVYRPLCARTDPPPRRVAITRHATPSSLPCDTLPLISHNKAKNNLIVDTKTDDVRAPKVKPKPLQHPPVAGCSTGH